MRARTSTFLHKQRRRGQRTRPRGERGGGFLQAAEGADVLQSGFTFIETESILAPSSRFVSLSLSGCNLFTSSLSSLASPSLLLLPLFRLKEKKRKKKPACFSALCLEFPYSVKPWQQAFPGGGWRRRLAVLCPLDGAAPEQSIAQTAARVSERGPGLT